MGTVISDPGRRALRRACLLSELPSWRYCVGQLEPDIYLCVPLEGLDAEGLVYLHNI